MPSRQADPTEIGAGCLPGKQLRTEIGARCLPGKQPWTEIGARCLPGKQPRTEIGATCLPGKQSPTEIGAGRLPGKPIPPKSVLGAFTASHPTEIGGGWAVHSEAGRLRAAPGASGAARLCEELCRGLPSP
ncbi:hypothetical protein A7982_12428 [Minicystis rosea]|nr:hypothetical protein A7982_12428 [Minicystis rosea]